MGQTILMAATLAGGVESAEASIDIPMTGHIVGVGWGIQCAYDTTADFWNVQLSFGSAYAFANDARSIISHFMKGYFNAVTAVGVVNGGENWYHPLPDVPVMQGERLYLHGSSATGAVAIVGCLIHFDFDQDRPQTRRR